MIMFHIVVTDKKAAQIKVPTLQTVAELAGVSRVTVSHILGGNGAERYSERTRRKVQEAALSLDYFPNRAAQIIRKGKSNQIGIIHFGMHYEVASKSMIYLSQSISEKGYDVFVTDLTWQGGNYRRVIEQLVQLRVEGLVVSQTVESFGEREAEILKRYGIPVVSVAGNEGLGIPVVYGDAAQALEELACHVFGMGHKRVMMLATRYDSRSTLSRIQGFESGVKASGATFFGDETSVEDWLAKDKSNQSGKLVRLDAKSQDVLYRYIRDLIARKALPDVLMCSNDNWARQAFSACLENGLSVPGDIAITGYDNDKFGEFAPYYLTTVDDRREDQCNLATELLMKMIRGEEVVAQHYVLPTQLVIRKSCGSELNAALHSKPL